MTYRLQDAIASVIFDSVHSETNSEAFIRINLPEKWPVLAAIASISAGSESAVIGPLSLGWMSQVSEMSPQTNWVTISDASELTRLRNEPRGADSNPILLLGDASGPEQSGLRDLKTVITSREIYARWKEIVREHARVTFVADLDQKLRSETAQALVALAGQEKLTANAVNDYLTASIDNESQPVETVFENLWLVDLIPDEELVNSRDRLKRLEENFSTIDALQEDFLAGGPRSKFRRYLAPSPRPEVQAFVRWLRGGSPDDLRASDLAQIAAALKREPSEVKSRISVLEMLNRGDSHELDVCLSDLDERLDQQIDAGQSDLSVKLEVKWERSNAPSLSILRPKVTARGSSNGLPSQLTSPSRIFFREPMRVCRGRSLLAVLRFRPR